MTGQTVKYLRLLASKFELNQSQRKSTQVQVHASGWPNETQVERKSRSRSHNARGISENTRNAWSFYYIWNSFGLWVFRNERLLNLLSLLLQNLFSSRGYMCVLGRRLTVTAKANCSRQKQIYSRQKQINSECDIFIMEVSLFSKFCYSSQ